MRKASTRLPEQGTQTPSPAPDLIPAETKNQPRTYIGIGTANGGTSVLPTLEITVEAALIFCGKTLVLPPGIAVTIAITVPVCPPIPIPIAVLISFPLPIAVTVPTFIAIRSHIAIGSICRDAIVLINVSHPLFHTADLALIIRASVTLPTRKIAVKTVLIIRGKRPPALRECWNQQDEDQYTK